jgi:hypothetical protein
MAKRADLSAFVVPKPGAVAPVAAPPVPEEKGRERGFKTKTFELTPEAAREFELLRAETGKKSYQLISEALNLLFQKYQHPQVG